MYTTHQNRLTKHQTDKLLALLSKIQKDSLYTGFRFLIEKDSPIAQEYYQTIRNPICLKEIRTRLTNGHYSTISDISRDFSLLWNNARQFNSPDDPYHIIANIGDLEVRKRLRKISKMTDEHWAERASIAAKKLDEAIHRMTEAIEGHMKEDPRVNKQNGMVKRNKGANKELKKGV